MSKAHNLIVENNDSFIASLLQKCNPFGLTLQDGRSMFFQQEVESYLFVMIQAWTTAPKGYLEMPLLMMALYRHLPYKACVELTKQCRRFDIDLVMLVDDWTSNGAKRFLDRLCSALCSFTDASYAAQYVDNAWQLFQQRMEIEKEKLSKMSNVKCGAFAGEGVMAEELKKHKT